MDSTTIVDLTCLQEYTDNDPVAMQELIDIFYETAHEDLKILADSIAEGKGDEWYAASHKLKGAAGYIGALAMKALCAEAQNMTGSTPAMRANLYRKIKTSYDDACHFLKERKQ